MSYRVGDVVARGAIIERCSYCGDSLDVTRGHFARFTDGAGYCYKCNTYERPKLELSRDATRERAPRLATLELPRKQSHRPTALDCYDASAHGYAAHDVFAMFDARGTLCGAHVRGHDKRQSVTLGQRGHSGYCARVGVLTIVEGPYDVLHDAEVCVYGSVLDAYKLLRGVSYVLCPDGDVDLSAGWAQRKLAAATRDGWNEFRGVLRVDGNPRDTTPARRAFIPARRVLC